MTPATGKRRLIPGRSIYSREYALFNEGVYLTLAGFFGYVLASPSAPTRQALAGPLSVLPDVAWGALFVVAGLAAVVGSFRPRHFRLARGVLLTAALLWTLVLLSGVGRVLVVNFDALEAHPLYVHGVLVGGYFDIVPGMVREVVARGLLSALIFGGVASHASRIVAPDCAQTTGTT